MYLEEDEKLTRIKSGDDLYLKTVYEEYRGAFIAFLLKRFNCEKNDAIEVYSEAFTVLYYRIKEEKLSPPLKSTLKTYLIGVGRNIFSKRFSSSYQKKMTFPEELKEESEPASIMEHFELEEQTQIVKDLLSQLKESCQQLIKLMYFKRLAAAEVAERMGFNSPGSARKHKYDCLKKMHKLLKKE